MDVSTAALAGLRASGHLCFPYETEDERRRTVVAFAREGLARRERCLFVGGPAELEALLAALAAAGVAVERALERGALVLATTAEIYLRKGRFDGDDALDVLEGLVDRALADGFVGLRATGESSATGELWSVVTRYEARLNERLGRRPFIALCRFAATLGPERVQDVLRTHPHALVRGEVCANPFYEHPEVVLSDDSRARLDWQLHQLRAHHRARKRLEARAGAPAGGDGAPERLGLARDRFLSTLAEELAEPLFALKREVHALGAALDDTPAPERLAAAQRHLRRLSVAVERARDMARLLEHWAPPDEAAPPARGDGDLVAIVREAAERHAVDLASAGASLALDAPASVSGAWDRQAVQRLVSTFLRGATARGAGRALTIGVRVHDSGATLTFHEGAAGPAPALAGDDARSAGGGYTVELPHALRRPRG
jgi:signal transduction histidine kinase